MMLTNGREHALVIEAPDNARASEPSAVGETCTCDRCTRRDVMFILHTPLPECGRFVSTVWVKYDSPNEALRMYGKGSRSAKTCVMLLTTQVCSECRGWRYCGDPAHAYRLTEYGPQLVYVYEEQIDYDPDRITEGGLSEAHYHHVARVRAAHAAIQTGEQ